MSNLSLHLSLNRFMSGQSSGGPKTFFYFEAFHRASFDDAVRLSTGKNLGSLPGSLRVSEEVEGKEHDELGTLAYVEAYPEADIPECFELDLTLSKGEFERLERWVRSNRPPLSLSVQVSGRIADGFAPDISKDTQWDNKRDPQLKIHSATFSYPIDTIERTGRRSYSDWFDLPKKFQEDVSKEAKEYFDVERGQVLELAHEVALRVYNYHGDADPAETLAYVRNSFRFLRDLQVKLNPLSDPDGYAPELEKYKKRLGKYLVQGNQKETVWRRKSVALAIQSGDSGEHYWPIDSYEVSELCFEYLKKPWMHASILELILVDSLLYQEALAYSDAVREKIAGFWGSLIGMNKSLVRLAFFLGGKTLVKWALYLLLAIAAGFGAGNSHGWWAGVLSGAGLWALFKYLDGLGNQDRVKMGELSDSMTRVSLLLYEAKVCPAFIKARLLATSEAGAQWPRGALALVEHAVNRNAVMWTD